MPAFIVSSVSHARVALQLLYLAAAAAFPFHASATREQRQLLTDVREQLEWALDSGFLVDFEETFTDFAVAEALRYAVPYLAL